MDLAQILGQLSRRRRLIAAAALLAVIVGISVAYKVSVSPLGLEKRSLELGVASTTLMIDTQRSSALDLKGDLAPLSSRASTYSSLASSDPVKAILARQVGIPAGRIISGATAASTQNQQQGAPQRSSSILKEKDVYRVDFGATAQDQPLLSVSTQAPTGLAAVKLANGAARALQSYVVRQQDLQGVPLGRRVTIRQLGAAEGGVINSGANPIAALLGGLATFLGACLMILFIDRLRADVRRKLVHDAQTPSPLAEARPGLHQARDAEAWRVDAQSEGLGDLRNTRSSA